AAADTIRGSLIYQVHQSCSQQQQFSNTTEHNDAAHYDRNIETTRTTDTCTIGGHIEDTRPVNPQRSRSIARHLLATTETEHQVKGGLLLDVIVRQGAAILKLLTSEDETLLVRGNALLVLDLRLHVVNGVRGLNLQGDGLASEGLDKNLHATTEPEHQVEGGLLLDVVVSEGAAILKLLASKDETLLVRRDALLVLDLSLDVVDGVRGLDLKGDGLAGEGLHKDLHL
uniref:Uncharacterized protein n=1 Tax=Aegilops tauschii subsp. strangulata TaxID=200361 RepID=A0A453SVC4_AEGTS